MACSTPSYRLGLQQIAAAAQSIKPSLYSALSRAGVQPPPKVNSNLNLGPTPPALTLPLPDEIVVSLLDIGCSQDAATSLSNAFINSARQIRDAYEASYRKLAMQFISDPDRFSTRLQKSGSFLERKYREQILSAKQVAVNQAKELQQISHVKPKPTFNQEFVPFLEAYFEYNAYPSAPDRAALARKSMMTTRQIEVWFQNHRNRAKKEGRPLRKLLSDPLPLKLSFESLEKRMPLFVVPEGERVLSTNPSSKDLNLNASTATTTDLSSTFGSEAPPHAFPTTYPPYCGYDPFPVRTESCSFGSLVWMRTPALTPSTRSTPTMDEIIADFATKLVLRDQSPKHRQKSPSLSTPKQVWFAATQTIPPPAPHPAFIPSTTHIRSPPTSLSFIRISPTRSPRPQSTDPFSRYPAPLVGAQRSRTAGRKLAPLPRRSPTGPSLNHRDINPPVSEALMSLQFMPSGSRSSSSSSGFSSNRHSSSGSSSSASSVLNTPVSSPNLLPNSVFPTSISSSDLQDEVGRMYESTHSPMGLNTFVNPSVKPQVDLNLPVSMTKFWLY